MTLQPMKRLEIVVDSLHLNRVIERLLDAEVSGYTVLPNASGFGQRGDQRADDVSGVSSNTYVLVAVTEEQADAILAKMRPLLKSYGGICLVSDCLWLDH